jgi:DNA-directed RNA polymerase subunit K/omega
MNEKYLDKAKKTLTDRRLLINGASKRAAELARGGRSLLGINPRDEPSYLDVALLEIAENKLLITPKNPTF